MAVACDQPFVRRAAGPAGGRPGGRGARRAPARAVSRPATSRPRCRRCARRWREASLRATLAALGPEHGGDGALVASVNTPDELAAAQRRAVTVAVIGGGIAGCALGGAARRGRRDRDAVRARGDRRRRVGAQLGRAPASARPAAGAALRGVADALRRARHGFACPAEPAAARRLRRRPSVAADCAPPRRASRSSRRSGSRAPRCRPPSPRSRRRAAPTGCTPAARSRPPPRRRAWAARARAAGARAGDRRARVTRRAGVARRRRTRVVSRPPAPWTPAAVGAPRTLARRSAPLWGVVAEVRLAQPPRHTIEEAGVEALDQPGGGAAVAVLDRHRRRRRPASARRHARGAGRGGGRAAAARARRALRAGAAREARIEAVRACARPLSADGRPLLGADRASTGCTCSPATGRGASRSGRGRRDRGGHGAGAAHGDRAGVGGDGRLTATCRRRRAWFRADHGRGRPRCRRCGSRTRTSRRARRPRRGASCR